uniref:Uncharacterized protein n=1 Tax=Arion vulgaris TaxID=1028688 RepID=A0A0B7A271_9EUPU
MDRNHTEEATDSIFSQAFRLNPQGNRGKERHRNTWSRELETEFKKMRREWRDLEKMALVADPCLPRGEKEEEV